MTVKIPNRPKKANDINKIIVVHPSTGLLVIYEKTEYPIIKIAIRIINIVIPMPA